MPNTNFIAVTFAGDRQFDQLGTPHPRAARVQVGPAVGRRHTIPGGGGAVAVAISDGPDGRHSAPPQSRARWVNSERNCCTARRGPIYQAWPVFYGPRFVV
jgi:hypothetical protein